MTSSQHSITQVAAILERLEDKDLEINESTFLSYGDDLLDYAIGLDSYAKNRWLLDCEPLPVGVYDGDAVCVGSGPSLDQHIDQLRDIQNRCLIVAAHSAVKRLMDSGVVPHCITPKERLPDPPKIPDLLPERVVYAGFPVVQYAPLMCQRHYMVGDSGRLADWMGFKRTDIKIGATSGTLSTWVAAALAKGTIWLVGHDMVQGHYRGFSFNEERQSGDIECADGQTRPANRIYRSCRNEIGLLACQRSVVQTALSGAKVEGATCGKLDPALGSNPELSPRKTDYTMRPHRKLARVEGIFRRVIEKCEMATRHEDMNMSALFEEEDHQLALAIMQPLWVQYSILRRTLNINDDQVTSAMRESMLNAFRSLYPWAKEMSNAFV